MEDQRKTAEIAVKTARITARQSAVIDALATGSPITAAAKAAGVARRTVHYWLEKPEFVQALESRRQDLRARVADEVAGLALASLGLVRSYIAGEVSERESYGIGGRLRLAADLVGKMGLLTAVSRAANAPGAAGASGPS